MPVLPEPSATEETSPPGQGLAVAAESLYLINLLLVPGLAFLVLLWLYRRHRNAPPMARQHLRQTLSASLWAGALLVIANLLIIALGGYAAASTWMIVILYFTTVHATLVMLGILGLAKALAGQLCSYPLIGELLP